MKKLLNEIEKEFPVVEKPSANSLMFHKGSCIECQSLLVDLENFSGKVLPNEGIKVIHQEMSSLSAKGWRWVLPSYLKYCVESASEPSFSNTEIEFLIYNFSPEKKFESEALERVSELSKSQLLCIRNVFIWLKSHEQWDSYFGHDIDKATHFLSQLAAN